MTEQDWLITGFSLWEETNFDRDYFLGLPNADLSGMLNVEASYVDAVAMGRVTLRSLLCMDGER